MFQLCPLSVYFVPFYGVTPTGGAVARRSLGFYEAVARRLATGSEQGR